MREKVQVRKYQHDHVYDALCKNVLSYKIVIAYILKEVVEEFKEMSIREIVDYYIHNEYSHDIISSFLSGDKELSSLTEGMVRFDLLFSTKDPQGKKGIIFDIEAQNKNPSIYRLENRGQYYLGRMLSSQKNVTFVKSHYDDIYKVFSIWIVKNPLKKYRNKIFHYAMQEKYHQYQNDKMNLMHCIIINLGGKGKGYTGICKTLDILLSEDKGYNEKLRILEKVTGVKVSEKMKGEIYKMCNLSQGVMAKGMKKGMKEGKRLGMREGRMNTLVESIRNLVCHLHITEEQAMTSLGVSLEERTELKKMLKHG